MCIALFLGSSINMFVLTFFVGISDIKALVLSKVNSRVSSRLFVVEPTKRKWQGLHQLKLQLLL